MIGEQIIREDDGRIEVFIPLPSEVLSSVILRSGGIPSSIVRIHQAQIVLDSVSEIGAIAPIELMQVSG